MLKAYSVKGNKDLKVVGGISDFVVLHQTVRKMMLVIADYEIEKADVSTLLGHFLGKIEQAYLGEGIKETCLVRKEQVSQYGFYSSWIELIFIHDLLRLLSGYAVLDSQDEVNLQLLEHLAEESLCEKGEFYPGTVRNAIRQSFAGWGIREFLERFNCSSDQLFPDVDSRLLLEVKKCLDTYFYDHE